MKLGRTPLKRCIKLRLKMQEEQEAMLDQELELALKDLVRMQIM